jgi:hypothetical protein
VTSYGGGALVIDEPRRLVTVRDQVVAGILAVTGGGSTDQAGLRAGT